MPNWCYGIVIVKGKPENIEKFCRLFLFEEDVGKAIKIKKFFARSFANREWKDFKEEFLGESEAEFGIDFAWSCYSCLIEGYPQDYEKKGVVTLEWACKEYDVSVTIESEEEGEGFEEYIKADKNGVDYSSRDMPEIKCLNCGNEQIIPTDRLDELEDVECYECGKYGEWEDKLKKMLEKKINNG